jgi:hypothetical protein
MEEFVFEATKDRLILPAENGGSVRLSKGNIVRGKFWLRFVGKGLKRKLEPSAMGIAPEQKKVAEAAERTETVLKSAPPPEDEPVPEPESAPAPEPEVEEEEPEEEDSLPKTKAELEKISKQDLIVMATDLGLDTDGSKKTLVKRLSAELGL